MVSQPDRSGKLKTKKWVGGRNMANKDAAGTMQLELVQDRKGMVWDLLLYIPTVIALASISASLWYGDNHNMGIFIFFPDLFLFYSRF